MCLSSLVVSRPPFVDGGGRPVLAARVLRIQELLELSFYLETEVNDGHTTQMPEALMFSETSAGGTCLDVDVWRVVRFRLFLYLSYLSLPHFVRSLFLSGTRCAQVYQDTSWSHEESSSPNRNGPRPLHSGPHGKSEFFLMPIGTTTAARYELSFCVLR